MDRVISVSQLSKLVENLKGQKKSVVLVGGCFDVLHPGHVIFLEKAKKCGDVLVVLLESDQKVRELKGLKRPVHTQIERAKVLSALKSVDYVIMLPYVQQNQAYEELIGKIAPDIIAATKGDPNSYHHQRVANNIGCKLKYVTRMIGNHSTSGILNCK